MTDAKNPMAGIKYKVYSSFRDIDGEDAGANMIEAGAEDEEVEQEEPSPDADDYLGDPEIGADEDLPSKPEGVDFVSYEETWISGDRFTEAEAQKEREQEEAEIPDLVREMAQEVAEHGYPEPHSDNSEAILEHGETHWPDPVPSME